MKITLIYLAVIYITWVHYLAVMALRVAYKSDRLPKGMRPPSYFVLFIGLIFDVVLNLIMSLPLLELPKYNRHEWLLTARFQRLIKEGGWRGRQAEWFCHNFLEPFDENHCK